MKSFVLDASVALNWWTDKEVSAPSRAAWMRLLQGVKPVVPVLFRYEVENGLVKWARRNRTTVSAVRLADLATVLRHIEIEPDASASLVSLAERTGLTVYDAAYLDLALRRGLPLITLDKKLRRAAQRLKGEIFG